MTRKKFAVIGLGRFGIKLVEELTRMNREVIAIDSDSNAIEKVKDVASESLILDAVSKEALEKSGVKDVDCVIVAIGQDMESNILVTTLLKEIGAKEIISRAESSLHARILKEVGADRIVFPEEDMAMRLAHAIHFPGVQEYIDIKGPWDLAELKVSSGSKLVGKKIASIRSELTRGINVLMIEREKAGKADQTVGQRREERENIFPKNEYAVRKDDILILFGRPEHLEKFIEKTV
jgi:trk system potassium uptake protein TrkA